MLAETIEHVADAAALGREAARALAPGGLCYITSPPRLRHLFGRDPHYGIRGLLAFPDLLQPWIFRRLRQGRPYEVRHTFWTQWGITRHFPGLRVAEVVSRNWAGFPRRLDWDWIILRKPSPP
jgi:SAM-dependent methyltransferase